MCAHLFRAHVQLGANLSRVPGQERSRCEGTGLFLILFLVHCRHQTKVSHLHYIIHGEEDVGGLEGQTLKVIEQTRVKSMLM